MRNYVERLLTQWYNGELAARAGVRRNIQYSKKLTLLPFYCLRGFVVLFSPILFPFTFNVKNVKMLP